MYLDLIRGCSIRSVLDFIYGVRYFKKEIDLIRGCSIIFIFTKQPFYRLYSLYSLELFQSFFIL